MSDSKSIEKQGKRVKELAKKVKEGKISLEELNEFSATLNALSDKVAVLKYLMAKNDFQPEVEDPISAEEPKEEPIPDISKEVEPEPVVETPVEESKPEEQPAFAFNLFEEPSDEVETDPEDNVVKTTEPESKIPEEPVVEVQESSSAEATESKKASEDDKITLDQLTPSPAEDKTEPVEPESIKDSSLQSAIEERKGGASLNDNYFGAQDDSLASKLKNTPIENLKAAIGINVKFTFINDLFAGNSDEFNNVVDAIDSMPNADDARNLLGELSGKHSWDLESHSVSQFVEMVERRFM